MLQYAEGEAVSERDALPGNDTWRVLVVDDSPLVQRVLARALSQHGYDCRAAETGAEAIEKIECCSVDAVLLDLGLPDIPGMQVLDRLKAISPTTEVIILTGNASLHSAVEAIDRQVFAYLEKPVLPDQIVGTLHRAIEKRWLSAENARLARELKAANQQLEERIEERTRSLELEKGRIQAIMDSLSDAVLMVDDAGRLASVNPAAEEMFGVTGSDLIGRRITGGKTPADDGLGRLGVLVNDRRKEHKRVLSDRRGARPFDPTWHKEVAIAEPKRCLLDVSSTPVLDQSDSLLGRAFVARDITTEREAERLKDEFVGLVSHELRTPLTTIAVALKILQGNEAGPLTAKQGRAIEMASRQCEMMDELIDRFLDISRIEADAAGSESILIDLAEIVSGALQQISGLAREKSIRISDALEHGDALVSIDEDQMLRVCMILLENAVKYTPAGGEIAIGTKVVGDELAMVVSDNGPGIPESERTRVFEKFYRGSNTSSSAPTGSGLGLALALLIVEKHSGRIAVECPAEGGSRFRVSLPLGSAQK